MSLYMSDGTIEKQRERETLKERERETLKERKRETDNQRERKRERGTSSERAQKSGADAILVYLRCSSLLFMCHGLFLRVTRSFFFSSTSSFSASISPSDIE